MSRQNYYYILRERNVIKLTALPLNTGYFNDEALIQEYCVNWLVKNRRVGLIVAI